MVFLVMYSRDRINQIRDKKVEIETLTYGHVHELIGDVNFLILQIDLLTDELRAKNEMIEQLELASDRDT